MANILIIDDDRLIRNALVIQLTQMKHTVMVAETLADGRDMLPLAPFCCYLSRCSPAGRQRS